MRTNAFLPLCFLMIFLVSCKKDERFTAKPINKLYGGSSSDGANSITNSTDGGYLLAGSTVSQDGDVMGKIGGGEDEDGWVIKLDGSENLMWEKTFGGSGTDRLLAIVPASGGGYVAAGFSDSNIGDVGHNHGGGEGWIIKFDGTGRIVWQKALGGSKFDFFISVEKTRDDGYIAVGYTNSNDGDVSGFHGDFDAWVVKIDADGNKQWQRALGGTGRDVGNAVAQSPDGGYIVGGYTNSIDGDVAGKKGGAGNIDAWMVKLDPKGDKLWQKTWGGSASEIFSDITSTSKGGYLLTGYTESNDAGASGYHGEIDGLAVQIDGDGNEIWARAYGGSKTDNFRAVIRNPGGGYLLAGVTLSNDGDATGYHGGEGADAWIIKIDDNGKKLWQKTLGGTKQDELPSIALSKLGGFVLGGSSQSNDGDVNGNHGGSDVWVLSIKDYYHLGWR